LRDAYDVKVTLVCTGRAHKPHHPNVMRHLAALKLGDQVRMLGPVSDELLTTLYQNANYLLFPSLFEGLSQSLLEGLHCHLPVVAADAASIPETVEDAGLLFDGLDTESIAEAVRKIETDRGLRDHLAASTPEIMARYSWSRAVPMLRACYRHVAGRKLNPEDQALLDEALR
jgi:glycosyltransferase involved in cell wall biosynthesis